MGKMKNYHVRGPFFYSNTKVLEVSPQITNDNGYVRGRSGDLMLVHTWMQVGTMSTDSCPAFSSKTTSRSGPENYNYRTLEEQERTKIDLLIANGLNRKEIAGQLGIHEKTVSTYLTPLLHKLNARTTVDLLRFAVDEGLLVMVSLRCP